MADAFFIICFALGMLLALWLLLVGLSALLFNRPLGLIAAAAARMEGEEPSVRPLGFFTVVVALVVAAATFAFPPLAIVFLIIGGRRYLARRRQTEKYAGLRTLK